MRRHPDDVQRAPRSASLFVLAAIAVLASVLFLLSGCAQSGTGDASATPTPTVTITVDAQTQMNLTSFTWVTWDETGNSATWIVYHKEDATIGLAHITTRDDAVNENDAVISGQDALELMAIIDQYDLDAWNGLYDKPAKTGFTITYIYNDGKTINTTGNPEARRGYGDVGGALRSYFDKIAGRYGA